MPVVVGLCLPPCLSFQRFRRSRSYLRMVGFLSRSPEFVPLEVSEVLGDPDMLQFFMLFLMANRY